MKKVFRFVSGSLLGLVVSVTPTYAAVVPCPNCSPIDRVQTAQSLGSGYHVIYDFPGALIRTFEVSCGTWVPYTVPGEKGFEAELEQALLLLTRDPETLDPGNPELNSECTATQVATDSGVQLAFDILLEIWLETGGNPWAKRVFLSQQNDGIPGGGSAFDLVGDFNRMHTATQFIGVNYASLGGLNLQGRAFMAIVAGGPVILSVTVQFSDGTQIDVKCELYPSESCSYVPGSALDPNGQPIPDSLMPNVPRTYNLDPAWADRWYDNANIHGIPVHYVGSFRPLRMNCAPAPTGVYECVGF